MLPHSDALVCEDEEHVIELRSGCGQLAVRAFVIMAPQYVWATNGVFRRISELLHRAKSWMSKSSDKPHSCQELHS